MDVTPAKYKWTAPVAADDDGFNVDVAANAVLYNTWHMTGVKAS
jgi:hypothetical protein